MNQQLYYIAFSIAGTNCFVTAQKTGHKLEDEKDFSLAKSRRPDFDPRQGIKLNYAGLMHSSGKPHSDPHWVMRVFRKLETLGWKVDDVQFKQRFFGHMKGAAQ